MEIEKAVIRCCVIDYFAREKQELTATGPAACGSVRQSSLCN